MSCHYARASSRFSLPLMNKIMDQFMITLDLRGRDLVIIPTEELLERGIASVVAAFLGLSGLNAGTPLLIASTPVSAVQPDANDRSSRKIRTRPL